jgi:hypothetical protein
MMDFRCGTYQTQGGSRLADGGWSGIQSDIGPDQKTIRPDPFIGERPQKRISMTMKTPTWRHASLARAQPVWYAPRTIGQRPVSEESRNKSSELDDTGRSQQVKFWFNRISFKTNLKPGYIPSSGEAATSRITALIPALIRDLVPCPISGRCADSVISVSGLYAFRDRTEDTRQNILEFVSSAPVSRCPSVPWSFPYSIPS